MADLWASDDPARWRAALDGYEAVIDRQGVAPLAELDRWYRVDLPPAIGGRRPAHVTRDELVRVTEWKMARGVWRARNLGLVKGNAAPAVVATSTEALARAPDPTAPIASLARLAGVGPATASAVAAAAFPGTYPFLDELVADRVPGLGPVAYTLGFYARYAEALRGRAAALGADWTPALVERAVLAEVGGKAGVKRG
jgi:uroporphyrinogen-III synthase